MAMITEAGKLVERVEYDAYGQARHRWGDDVHDHLANGTDAGVTNQRDIEEVSNRDGCLINGGPINGRLYNADLDINRDGVIDSTDLSLMMEKNALPAGMISAKGEAQLGYEPEPGFLGEYPRNPFGYCGYVYNESTELHTVRFRHYLPRIGRWIERDPAGYVDGMGLYEYVGGRPANPTDPLGLDTSPCGDMRPGGRCSCEVCNPSKPSPPAPPPAPGAILIKINFGGSWSQQEKDRVLQAISSAKIRADQLANEVDIALTGLSPCVRRKVEAELREFQSRMRQWVFMINNVNDKIDMYQRSWITYDSDGNASYDDAETYTYIALFRSAYTNGTSDLCPLHGLRLMPGV